jgi:hypothetical protein
MDLPPEVLATVAPEAQQVDEKKEEKQEQKPEPEPQPEPEPEPEPAAAEGPNGEEDHTPEDWPQSAKSTIREERAKKRKWKQTAEELQAQLRQGQQQPPVVMPNTQDPLVNVLDLGTLAQVEAAYTQISDFAEDNPDGAYDVLMGIDAQGKEIRKDFTAAEIAKMRQDARPVLRAIPARRQYLAELKNNTEEAQHSYGEMFKEGTEFNTEASQLVALFPEIRRSPEWLLWLGDAIAGRKARLAKGGKPGGKPLSPEAQVFANAPKVKPAPSVSKARSQVTREGNGEVDAKQAREEFATRGYSNEAMEDYVTKLRLAQNRGSGPRQKALT